MNFHYREQKVFMNLYKQYVSPHLEFLTPAWSPWLRQDLEEKLENIQKRAFSMVSGLVCTTYEERCNELGQQSLEERQEMQDLSLYYKYMSGHGGLKADGMFDRLENREGARTRLVAGTDNLKLPVVRKI
jgi:hypothetical protein